MHVAVIPARSGSKGIPNKNLLKVWDYSLIALSALCARSTGLFSDVILSTDSMLYAEEGQRFGCLVPYLRPDLLASDTTAMADVLLDLLQNVEGAEQWQTITLFQPTSPLRMPETVTECFSKCLEDASADACMTVNKVPIHFHALKQRTLDDTGYLKLMSQDGMAVSYRQQLPATFVFNGEVVIVRCEYLRKARDILNGRTRSVVSESSVNLDTVDDLAILRSVEAKTPPPAWLSELRV